MTRYVLNLADEEIMALGYALMAGVEVAARRPEDGMGPHLRSLDLKIRANAAPPAEATPEGRALLAVLLFHHGGPWTHVEQARWEALGGGPRATTRALCDLVRAVLGEPAEADR